MTKRDFLLNLLFGFTLPFPPDKPLYTDAIYKIVPDDAKLEDYTELFELAILKDADELGLLNDEARQYLIKNEHKLADFEPVRLSELDEETDIDTVILLEVQDNV